MRKGRGSGRIEAPSELTQQRPRGQLAQQGGGQQYNGGDEHGGDDGAIPGEITGELSERASPIGWVWYTNGVIESTWKSVRRKKMAEVANAPWARKAMEAPWETWMVCLDLRKRHTPVAARIAEEVVRTRPAFAMSSDARGDAADRPH